jgi:hypothetical protein
VEASPDRLPKQRIGDELANSGKFTRLLRPGAERRGESTGQEAAAVHYSMT